MHKSTRFIMITNKIYLFSVEIKNKLLNFTVSIKQERSRHTSLLVNFTYRRASVHHAKSRQVLSLLKIKKKFCWIIKATEILDGFHLGIISLIWGTGIIIKVTTLFKHNKRKERRKRIKSPNIRRHPSNKSWECRSDIFNFKLDDKLLNLLHPFY